MRQPGEGLPENQTERTLLAWWRTMIGALAALGIGGIHIAAEQHYLLGLLTVLLSLLALWPILTRVAALRRREVSATWQPLALTGGVVVLAVLALWLG